MTNLTRAAVLCTTLTLASVPVFGQTDIPDTPAGRALRAWLDAYNSGDSARVADFLGTYHVEGDFRNAFAFCQMTGGLDLLRIAVSEPRHLEFLSRMRRTPMVGYSALDVSPDDPTRLSGSILPLGPNVTVDALRIDARNRARVVGRVAALLDSVYVSPELGRRMRDSLRSRLGRGAYSRYANGPGLAIRLDTDLEQIAHDRHLHLGYAVRPRRLHAAPSPEDVAQQRRALAETHCGFRTAEQLDGNIGYLRLDSFDDPALCAATADSAMTSLAGTRALIIDLRENGGGTPEMVALVASYLFERRTHLNDLWTRVTDSRASFWTRDSVAGRRFGGEKPVYVLTSAHTFSAAEEFAYDLQSLKRATIVGETTGGGAHPVSDAAIDDHFVLILPWGKAINPVTGTNWEGVGVVPDVKVPASAALTTARSLLGDQQAP